MSPLILRDFSPFHFLKGNVYVGDYMFDNYFIGFHKTAPSELLKLAKGLTPQRYSEKGLRSGAKRSWLKSTLFM